MAPKRKFALSQNPLRFGASSSSSDPTTLLFGSMMNKPERTSWRTFLDKAFIQNAKSFCWTSLTLTYPLSVHVDLGVLLQHAKIWLLNTFFCYLHSKYVHSCHTKYCIRCTPCPEGRTSWLPPIVSVWGLCPKRSSFLLFVSVHSIGVIVSSLFVRPLLKALSFWTWLWLLFFIPFLIITLLMSLMLDFCFLY